jgi:exonuclease SbcC
MARRARAMQLDKLHMRNFKRYRHQDVVFREGITGILGNNGTGKSTIVDAILFCLYGIQGTGLQYILSATAGKRDRARVRLDFSVRGEKYQLVRCLGPGKKHDAQLHHEGRLLAKGVSEVQQATRKVIRMGHADFRHTIFSGQQELLTLVGAKPEERKQWFREVLGIDRMKDKGGAILKEEAVAARERMLLIAGRLGDINPEAILAEQEELARKSAGTGEAVRSFECQLQDLEERSRSLEGEIAVLRGLEREVLELRAGIRTRQEELARVREEHARIGREIGELAGQREEFQALEAAEPAFEDLRARLEAGRAEKLRHEALLAQEARTKNLLIDLQATLDREREEEVALDRDAERLQALAPAIARRAEILAALQVLGTREEKYHALAAALATRDEALRAAGRRGAELRQRLGKAREAVARLDGLVEPHRLRAPWAVDPMAVLESVSRDLVERIARSTATREHALPALAKREGDLATLEAQGTGGTCPTCRQPLGEQYLEIIGDLRCEVEQLREDLASADEAIAGTESEKKALDALLVDARRLREEGNRLGELTGDWEAVQELTRRELAGKEQVEKEMAALAHDPGERRGLEEELASLDPSWREHIAISDRLERRPGLARRIRDHGESHAKLKEELTAIGRERADLGFDAARHGVLEEESGIATERHRRFLAMKDGMNRLPHLEERAAALAARSDELREELERLDTALRENPFSADALARKEQELQSHRAAATKAVEEGARLKAELAHLAAEKRRLADLLVKFELDRQEHDRLREEIELLELTREQLNGFTDHLLGVVRGQVQEETGRILSEITDGRYDTVILDDAFELLVHDLGGDFPVSRFSGGEQDDVAIALRIALSRYIAGMHELHENTFLIFDEIFGSQDEERRGNIFRALRALEPFFPQIFLISHVTEVQGEFGNTLVVEAVSGTESSIRDLEEAGS